MNESAVFESTCEALARATSFDNPSARGTVRHALKSAGLDARQVTSAQMRVVLKHVLPGELRALGIKEPDAVCSTIAERIAGIAPIPAQGPSVEDVFRRLGGD